MAIWKERSQHNDYLWAECSNCGFRVQHYYAVETSGHSCNYINVKPDYQYCSRCGKKMYVPRICPQSGEKIYVSTK